MSSKSKKILGLLNLIDESLSCIDESIPFRWAGDGEEKWTDKWVQAVQSHNAEMVGKFKKEISVKVNGKAAWALQFTKMTFIGVTTSKKGGEILYVVPNGEVLKKNQDFREFEDRISSGDVFAYKLPANVKGMKQVKTFLASKAKEDDRVKTFNSNPLGKTHKDLRELFSNLGQAIFKCSRSEIDSIYMNADNQTTNKYHISPEVTSADLNPGKVYNAIDQNLNKNFTKEFFENNKRSPKRIVEFMIKAIKDPKMLSATPTIQNTGSDYEAEIDDIIGFLNKPSWRNNISYRISYKKMIKSFEVALDGVSVIRFTPDTRELKVLDGYTELKSDAAQTPAIATKEILGMVESQLGVKSKNRATTASPKFVDEYDYKTGRNKTMAGHIRQFAKNDGYEVYEIKASKDDRNKLYVAFQGMKGTAEESAFLKKIEDYCKKSAVEAITLSNTTISVKNPEVY